MTYAPGDRVTHTSYGDGTLVSVNEYHTVIDFDAHGLRTFSSPRVVLSTATTEAPPKRARRPRAKRADTKRAADPKPDESPSDESPSDDTAREDTAQP